jgi:tRNA (adenine22-N1)-methyltransferase
MNRIELLASLTKGSNLLLDLGCDHAYVLIDAIKRYDVKAGIASDISDGPLEKAKDSIIKSGLINKIKIIKSDGFKNINDNFDTCIIAGMGGILIKDILEEGINKINNSKLILEANNNRDILRSFLYKNDFMIIDEYAIYDSNKYYEIIVCKKGKQELSNFEINYGPILLQKRPDEFINYYKEKYDFLNKIIPSIKNDNERIEKIKLLNDYKKIIGE